MWATIKIIFLSLCILSSQLHGVVIGSDTALSRQPTAYFPAKDTDNTMLGFAAFSNGFYLEDFTTSCTFDSFFSANGPENLNGGSLFLKQKHDLQSDFALLTVGNVIGNANTVTLPQSTVDANIPRFGQFSTHCFFKKTQVTVPAQITSLDVNHNDKYLVAGLLVNPNPELLMYEIKDSRLAPVSIGNAFKDMAVNCVRWHPTQDFLVVGYGDKIFSVFEKTDTDFVLAAQSDLGNKKLTSCIWHPGGQYFVIAVLDGGLQTYAFTQYPYSLMAVSNTSIAKPSSIQSRAMVFSSSGNFLIVGVNTTPQNALLNLYSFNAGFANLISSIPINAAISSLSINNDGILAVACAGNTENIRLFEFDEEQIALNAMFNITQSHEAFTIDWDWTGHYLAVGDEKGFGALQVNFFQPDDPVGQYLYPVFYTMNPSQALNNCMLGWSRDGQKLFAGGLNKTLEYYQTTQKPLMIKDCVISMPRSYSLTCPLVIEGDCVIKGADQSAILSMAENASITINPNATLTFENIEIDDLHDSNLIGSDETSSLILNRTKLALEDNFTFSCGCLCIREDVIVEGVGKTFFYKSMAPLTIYGDSTLTCESGITFRYDPWNKAPNLIVFDELSSQFILQDATLNVGPSGLHLTKGALVADGLSYIDTELVTEVGAFQLGNGNADDDCMLHIDAVSKMILSHGYCVYKNVQLESSHFNVMSALRVNPAVVFKLYFSIRAVFGGFEVSSSAGIIREPGANFIGDYSTF